MRPLQNVRFSISAVVLQSLTNNHQFAVDFFFPSFIHRFFRSLLRLSVLFNHKTHSWSRKKAMEKKIIEKTAALSRYRRKETQVLLDFQFFDKKKIVKEKRNVLSFSVFRSFLFFFFCASCTSP